LRTKWCFPDPHPLLATIRCVFRDPAFPPPPSPPPPYKYFSPRALPFFSISWSWERLSAPFPLATKTMLPPFPGFFEAALGPLFSFSKCQLFQNFSVFFASVVPPCPCSIETKVLISFFFRLLNLLFSETSPPQHIFLQKLPFLGGALSRSDRENEK